MNKNDLRTKYKALREKLTPEELDEKSLEIANQTLNLEIWELEFFHIFLSITSKREINTEYILQIIFGKDANAVIPKMKNSKLEHYLLTDSTKLKLNKWGIPEPEKGIKIDTQQIDVVFIPLLAFDKSGNRVGYGKGFYDKFLVDCKPETLKIGLSFFEAEEHLEPSKHDIPLDYCVTPQRIYKF